jgi:preprotein translocase subunit SecG
MTLHFLSRLIVAMIGLWLIFCLWLVAGEQAPGKRNARGDASTIGRAW